jgi:hypothetical protein
MLCPPWRCVNAGALDSFKLPEHEKPEFENRRAANRRKLAKIPQL